MKVLVTGATGFVGRALVPVLTAAGHQVIATSRNPAAKIAGAEVIAIGGLGPETDWRLALDGIEAVIHLAARVHVMDETAVDPLAENRRVNTAGTIRLARDAAAAGVRRLVFLSTVKVNGERTDGQPFTEKDAPAPSDPYAIAKDEAEQGIRDISAKTGMGVTVIRPPLVYGPGVAGNFVSLLRLCARGLPLPLASVHNSRSLIYVGNLVDAILAAVDHPAAAGKTYLVGDGDDVSTAALIRDISAALDAAGMPGRRPAVWPMPPVLLRLAASLAGKSAAASRLLGDLSVDDAAIRHDLGWTPPFSMVQGLKETAAWFVAAEKNRK